MFRGFREIRVREVDRKKQENPEDKNYLKIKPETDITVEEAEDFWDQLFENIATSSCRE